MTVSNTGIPVLSGTAQQGKTLTTTNGTWTFDLDYLTYDYQWERCDVAGMNCVDVTGATSVSYVLQQADVGHTMRSRVHATEHSGAVTGDLYAAPGGSDSNNGAIGTPFATVGKLIASLTPGQTGMLRAGTYGSQTGYPGENTNGGTVGNPITITNFPGEKATIQGYFSCLGSNVTFRNLYFDGSNDQFNGPCAPDIGTYAFGLILAGSNIIFENNDLTQSGKKGSGILQGDHGSNTGHNNIYRNNRIHDTGACKAQDHCIYWGFGNDGQVYNNWFWNNNHGWAIQAYPNCVRLNAFSNVADHIGSFIVISDSDSGSTNHVNAYNNVVTNMGTTAPTDFSAWTGSAGAILSGIGESSTSTGSTVHDNLHFNCPDGERTPGQGQNISLSGNIHADPLYVNGAAHNYLLQGGSPAAGFGLPTSTPGPDV